MTANATSDGKSRTSADGRRQRSNDGAPSSQNGKSASDNGGNNGGRNGTAPGRLARRAAAELADLLGRTPESIISLDRTDDGWRVGVEVLETRRIPDTADVLAEYEIETDGEGELVGYHRVRRYARGRARDDR